MKKKNIIVEKKKNWNSIKIVLLSPIVIMFYYISIAGLIRGNRETDYDFLAFIFLLIISIIASKPLIFSIKKVLSNGPEFEITNNEIIIFDNPYAQSIPLEEIKNIDIYRYRFSKFLRLTTKEDSLIKRDYYRLFGIQIRNKRPHQFYIILDFANIDSIELLRELKERIKGI